MSWQAAQNRPLALSPTGSLPPVARLLVTLGYALANWQFRRTSRKALSRLDERMLHDIGLSLDLRDGEIGKPFWRP